MKQVIQRIFGAIANPVSVFLATFAIFLVSYLVGIRPACRPLIIVLALFGGFGIIGRWYHGRSSGGSPEVSLNKSTRCGKLLYTCAAFLAAEILLSLSVVDVGNYWQNKFGNTFQAVRILKTPSGPVDKVYFNALGFALKPCPRCTDKAEVGESSSYVQENFDTKNKPTWYTCIKVKALPKTDPATMIGLFSNEMDPRQAMKMMVWDRMESCAKRIKEWPEGATLVSLDCPTDGLPFTFDHVTVGKCR